MNNVGSEMLSVPLVQESPIDSGVDKSVPLSLRGSGTQDRGGCPKFPSNPRKSREVLLLENGRECGGFCQVHADESSAREWEA